MRTIALTLLACAGLALTGCNGGASSDTAATQAKQPVPTEITGSVSQQVPGNVAVSENASLELKLVNISGAQPKTVASRTINPVGSMPVNFTLPFDRSKIRAGDIYIVRAELVDGERHFNTPLEYPVLTQGGKAQIAIKVVAVPTESEEMYAEFGTLRSSIGGMDIQQGTSMGDSSSRAWQIFRKNGAIHFVKENVDYFNDKRQTTAYTTTSYAYRSGKPWVVEQEHKANSNAEPSSIDRAGWDENGELVLHKHITAAGETSELSAEEAADLREQAESMFERAKK